MWPFDAGASPWNVFPRKPFSPRAGTWRRFSSWRRAGGSFLAAACIGTQAFAADAVFLGKDSCASSSCHGGGGANQNQSLVWSRQDQHARAPATLTTARSKRLAQVLKISDPTRDVRCTACHAPWQNLPILPSGTSATAEAVSCESCHGAAGSYIRSHTRRDLTRAEKRVDGLRDLTVLYHRANSCVACHQVVDEPLLAAGHPELLFELDGQSASMPRHWRERETNTHAATWLTGQAAALRELTWQMKEEAARGKAPERVFVPWQSALWVVNAALPAGPAAAFDTNAASSAEKLGELHRAADQLALEAAALAKQQDAALLKNLASASSALRSNGGMPTINAARAERAVLGMDRLLYGRKREGLRDVTNEMFELVQSRPDFNAEAFSKAAARFNELLQ